jgi:hypothetical protein
MSKKFFSYKNFQSGDSALSQNFNEIMKKPLRAIQGYISNNTLSRIRNFMDERQIVDQPCIIDKEILKDLFNNFKKPFKTNLDKNISFLLSTSKNSDKENFLYNSSLISIISFLMRLHFYIAMFDCSVLTLEEYYFYSFNHDISFAEQLKKLRSLAFLKSVSSRPLPYILNEMEDFRGNSFLGKFLDIKDRFNYDDFLNEAFLINFKETSDDFIYSLRVHEEFSMHDVYKPFGVDLLKSFKVDFDEITNEDLIGWFSDSSMFNEDDPAINTVRKNLRSAPKFGKAFLKDFLTKDFRYKRTIIPVSPANARDAWTADLRTFITLKYLSFKLKKVVSKIPFSMMTSSINASRRKKEFSKKFKDLGEDGIFFMLDIKKCGLSLSHELLKETYKILEEVYPGEFEFLQGYWNTTVKDADINYKIISGTGLGMGNELTTLIQSILCYVMYKNDNIESLVYNDDSVFLTTSQNVKQNLLKTVNLYTKCGILINFKKVLISRANVFCEEYFNFEEYKVDYSKLQLTLMPIINCFFQRKLYEVKRIFSNLEYSFIGSGISLKGMPEFFVEIYGFEFHKLESYLPYCFGGYSNFTDTNFSGAVRWYYAEYNQNDNQLIGVHPFFQEWVSFLIASFEKQGLEESIRFKAGSIKSVNFLQEYYQLNSSLESRIFYTSTGILSPEEKSEIVFKTLNFRGAQNLKYNLKIGFENKFEKHRKKLFKEFKKQRCLSIFFDKSMSSIHRLISFIKCTDENSKNIGIPDFIITESYNIKSLEEKFKINLIRKFSSKQKIEINSYRDLNNTLESYTTKRLVNINPFIIKHIISSTKDRYIKSNLPVFKEKIRKVPDFFRVFCASKRTSMIEFITHYRKIPTRYLSSGYKYDLDQIQDPVSYVYPNLHGLWIGFLRKFYKDFLLDITNVFKKVVIKDEDDLKRLIDIMEKAFTLSPKTTAENINVFSVDELGEIDFKVTDPRILGIFEKEDTLDDLLNEFDEKEIDPADFDPGGEDLNEILEESDFDVDEEDVTYSSKENRHLGEEDDYDDDEFF